MTVSRDPVSWHTRSDHDIITASGAHVVDGVDGVSSRPPSPTAQNLKPLVQHPRLGERVFTELRDAIVAGDIAPGSILTIETLASMLGVSRTPIREALPALQQLGLIEPFNGGLRVTLLDETYIIAIYGIRSALEGLAAEVTASHLTDQELTHLRHVGLPAHSDPSGDYAEMIGPDLSLHDFIREKCPLPFLNAMIDTNRLHRTRLIDLEHSASREHRHASLQEHEAIINALEKRNGTLARQLTQAHLDRVAREVVRVSQERPGADESGPLAN
jgi:DNA-binding GntR family transcriptional regulator